MTKKSTQKADNTVLYAISTWKGLAIGPYDGTENSLLQSKDIFKGGISYDGSAEDLRFLENSPGAVSPEISVSGYETLESVTFQEAFESFAVDLHKLGLAQAQIRGFCAKYPRLIWQNKNSTLFLLKERGRLFIAAVYLRGNMPALKLGPIKKYGEGSVLSRFCLLVPQPIV